jgi:hypothetical protein
VRDKSVVNPFSDSGLSNIKQFCHLSRLHQLRLIQSSFLHMNPQEFLLLRCGHCRPPCAPPLRMEKPGGGPVSHSETLSELTLQRGMIREKMRRIWGLWEVSMKKCLVIMPL